MAITSTDELIQGALYDLPNGQRVAAERPAEFITWCLRSPEAQRVYVIDPAGAVRLMSYEDEHGERHCMLGEEEVGTLTDFVVQDLRPVVG